MNSERLNSGTPRVMMVIPCGDTGHSMIFARRQAGELAQAGAGVNVFHLESRTSLVRLSRGFIRFRRELRRIDAQLVHSQFGTVTALFSALAGLGKPLVITFRGSDLNPPPSSAAPWSRVRAWVGIIFSQLAALKATRIVCVSQALKRRLWWRRNRVVVLPSGVDLHRFRPMGRDEARRRLKKMLAIRCGLGPSGRNVRFPNGRGQKVVLFNAGKDPMVKRLNLARQAAEWAGRRLWATKRIRVRLVVLRGDAPPDEMPLWINACDCLLLTSEREGSPTVVQEAIACEVPVVAVDVGDVRERVRGSASSRIAAANPESLGVALAEVLQLPRPSGAVPDLAGISALNIAMQLRWLYLQILEKGGPSGVKAKAALDGKAAREWNSIPS